MHSIPYPDSPISGDPSDEWQQFIPKAKASNFEPRYGYFSPWGRLTMETLQCVVRMDDTPDYENLSVEDAHYLSLYVAEAYNYACKHNAIEYISSLLDNFNALREYALGRGTGEEYGHDEAYTWLSGNNV
tara:strand:- start:148 stop:537 length:390 start_codon:yes stop_codon:yes gene_type:complete